MVKPQKTTKLYVKPGRKVKRTNFWMNPAAEEYLNFLSTFYEKQLGRPVSTSLVTRRALEALAGHIKSLRFKKSYEEMQFEAAKIVKHIR